MDQSVLDQLESLLNKVGADTLWKKTLGERTIWLVPISYTAQEKVTEVLTSSNGILGLSDSKRVTLSHAVVGIDDFDFREYSAAGSVFPVKNAAGQTMMTTLDRFIYFKMGEWGAQYVDDLFSLYADLMEAYQKDNLKGIQFDSSTETEEDLKAAEERVAELKVKLGAVEKSETVPEAPNAPPGPPEPPPVPVINDRY